MKDSQMDSFLKQLVKISKDEKNHIVLKPFLEKALEVINTKERENLIKGK